MEICSRSLFMYATPPVGGEKGGGTRSEKGEAMLKEVSAQGRYAHKFVPLQRFYLIVVL